MELLSDIHLETENSDLLQEVKAHWAAQGYRGYEKLKGGMKILEFVGRSRDFQSRKPDPS